MLIQLLRLDQIWFTGLQYIIDAFHRTSHILHCLWTSFQTTWHWSLCHCILIESRNTITWCWLSTCDSQCRFLAISVHQFLRSIPFANSGHIVQGTQFYSTSTLYRVVLLFGYISHKFLILQYIIFQELFSPNWGALNYSQ